MATQIRIAAIFGLTVYGLCQAADGPPTPSPQAGPTPTVKELIVSGDLAQYASAAAPQGWLRNRPIAVNPSCSPTLGGTIHAPLFPDTELEITAVTNEPIAGAMVTRGYVNGDISTTALLSRYRNSLSAVFCCSDGRVFSIFSSSSGYPIVAEWDPTVPKCAGTIDGASRPESISAPTDGPAGTPASIDSSAAPLVADSPGTRTIVDVMVLYSTAAKTSAGGDAPMRSQIALNVGFMNSALFASGAKAEIRLVYYAEATWHTESNDSQDLDWLSSDATVRSLRGQYGADIIVYLKTIGGTAYLFGPYSCVTFNNPLTFSHEVGHNLGCQHDRPNAGLCSTCPSYSYGYSFTPAGQATTYGTIMSYVGLTTPYYSNPSNFWAGSAMGVADNLPNSADNSHAISADAPTVAAWMTPPQVAALASPGFVNSSTFAFNLTGPPSVAGTYTIEWASAYPGPWTLLGNYSFSGGNLAISDSTIGSSSQRFYRAKLNNALVGTQLGFIIKSIPAGQSMLGNQLDAGDNSITALWPAPANGTIVYKFDAGTGNWINVQCFNGVWYYDAALSMDPGEGFVVDSPTQQTLTFVGNVLPAFSLELPAGWALVCSPVPQSGAVSAVLGFPFGNQADQIWKGIPGQAITYSTYTSSGSSWTPQPEPTMGLGESFWSNKTFWYYNDNKWSRVFWTWP